MASDLVVVSGGVMWSAGLFTFGAGTACHWVDLKVFWNGHSGEELFAGHYPHFVWANVTEFQMQRVCFYFLHARCIMWGR